MENKFKLKKEDLEKKKRFVKIKERLAELEEKYYVKLYIKWLNLSQAQKTELSEKWAKYYVDVKGTEKYRTFQAQRESMRIGDWAQVKVLCDYMKTLKNELVKPSTEDPDVIIHSSYVNQYINLKREVDELYKDSKKLEDLQSDIKKLFG